MSERQGRAGSSRGPAWHPGGRACGATDAADIEDYIADAYRRAAERMPPASSTTSKWTPDASVGHQRFAPRASMAFVQKRPAPSGQTLPQPCCAPIQAEADRLQQE